MDTMGPDSPPNAECGLQQALEIMGERWSFLILRAAFEGVVHFDDFCGQLGIARNILADRLAKFVDRGILFRLRSELDRRRVEYRLTPKGIALLPSMLALRQWGERHAMSGPSARTLVDRRDGKPIAPIVIRAEDGRELAWQDLAWADQLESAPPALAEEAG